MFNYDSALKLEDIHGVSNTKILNHIKKTKSYIEGLRAGEELKRSNLNKEISGDDVKRNATQSFQINIKSSIGKKMAANMPQVDIKEEDENENEDESNDERSEEDDNNQKEYDLDMHSPISRKISRSEKSSSHSNDLDVSRGQRSYRNHESNPSLDEVKLPFSLPTKGDPTPKIISKTSDRSVLVKNSVRQSLFSHAVGNQTKLLAPKDNQSQKSLLIPPLKSNKP